MKKYTIYIQRVTAIVAMMLMVCLFGWDGSSVSAQTVTIKVDKAYVKDGSKYEEIEPDDSWTTQSCYVSTIQKKTKATLPKYNTIYKEGYALVGWYFPSTESKYGLGTQLELKNNENLDAYPLFQKSSDVKFAYRTAASTLKYCFTQGTGGVPIKLSANTTSKWNTDVTVSYINNNKESTGNIDIPLIINTGSNKSGVYNNSSNCYFSKGASIIIPVCKGARITVSAQKQDFNYLKINGKTGIRTSQRSTDYIWDIATGDDTGAETVQLDISSSVSIKTITITMPASDPASVYANTDDETKISSSNINIEDNSTFPGTDLGDGGVSFKKGATVQISAISNFGYKVKKWIDSNTGDELATRNDDDTYTCADGFSVTTDPTNKKKDILTITSLDKDRTITVSGAIKETCYLTYNTVDGAEGTVPATTILETGDKFTIPENKTLYLNGYTLKYWKGSDGNVYTKGKTYTITSDLTLTPNFDVNKFSLYEITTDTKAEWKLTTNDGAPSLKFSGTSGILVTQLEKDGDYIDVRIKLDGTNGVIDNTQDADGCQTNSGAVITVPTTYNCVVTVATYGGNLTNTEICGHTGYVPATEVTVTNDESSVENTINLKDDGISCTTISITYIEQSTQTKLTSLTYGSTTIQDGDDDFATLKDKGEVTLKVDPDFVNDTPPTVSGTAVNGSTVVTQATSTDPTAYLVLYTSGGGRLKTYTIKFEYNVPTTAPTLKKVTVNNEELTEEKNSFTGQPVNGTITMEFDRTMSAAEQTITYNEGNSKITISATSGKTLTFKYSGLDYSIDNIDFTFSAGTLKDIYGGVYDKAISFQLSTKFVSTEVIHRKFNFIVGTKDGDINKAIEAANAAEGDSRYFIFVPDNEYNLGTSNISITRQNVSFIGQSQDATHIYNNSVGTTTSTSTLSLNSGITGFYCQDMAVENTAEDDGSHGAAALRDAGNMSVFKNVSLLGWRNTYFSSNTASDFRSYLETCKIGGANDFISGNGNIWFEQCDIMVRNAVTANIAYPNTSASQDWGFILNDCNVIREGTNQNPADNALTLGRPWDYSPAVTYLSTVFSIIPADAGWASDATGKVLRFHESTSKRQDGTVIDLSKRTLPSGAAKNSDDCRLTTAGYRKYNTNNVLEINGEFDPKFTEQIPAVSNLIIDSDIMQWDVNPDALCYFIFKKDASGQWIYQDNVAETDKNKTTTTFDLTDCTEGYYMIRAANQHGGLGEASVIIRYVKANRFDLKVSEVGSDKGYGWSTICLSYNAVVPTKNKNNEDKEFGVYAAVKVENYTVTLQKVNYITANTGYIVYGEADDYVFKETTLNKAAVESRLGGNPNDKSIAKGDINCYVLSYKSYYGVGFYKYTGTTLPAHRAYLSSDLLSEAVYSSAKPVTFIFLDEEGNVEKEEEEAVTTAVSYATDKAAVKDVKIYDFNGLPVTTPVKGHIYIVNGVKTIWQ